MKDLGGTTVVLEQDFEQNFERVEPAWVRTRLVPVKPRESAAQEERVEGQSSGGGGESGGVQNGALRLREHEESGGALRIAVGGDLDLNTVDALRPAIESACGSRAAVTLDLRAVEFIDSAGLALLVEARKRFTPPCTIRLRLSPQGQVQRALKLGRFDTFFEVESTPET